MLSRLPGRALFYSMDNPCIAMDVSKGGEGSEGQGVVNVLSFVGQHLDIVESSLGGTKATWGRCAVTPRPFLVRVWITVWQLLVDRKSFWGHFGTIPNNHCSFHIHNTAHQRTTTLIIIGCFGLLVIIETWMIGLEIWKTWWISWLKNMNHLVDKCVGFTDPLVRKY